jgi:hypothetical protein
MDKTTRSANLDLSPFRAWLFFVLGYFGPAAAWIAVPILRLLS